MTHNLAYDRKIFPSERRRINRWGCYVFFMYTGARPAELVDAERKDPKDGSRTVLFGMKVVTSGEGEGDDDDGEPPPPDKDSKVIIELLVQEFKERRRPKALCYEDIVMMMVRHPVTGRNTLAMAVRFTHHKGADNRPKPFVLSLLYAYEDGWKLTR